MTRLVTRLAIGAVILFGTAAAARPDDVSWGKAGTGFDQYRRDSVDCGVAGATRDMSRQQAYKEAMHGITLQNSIIDSGGESGDILRDDALVQRRTMQNQVPALQRYLVNGVERCLMTKGYRPFRLNYDQQRTLRKLHRGSERRFRYLHGLASDGSVLAAQGLDVEPAAAPATATTGN